MTTRDRHDQLANALGQLRDRIDRASVAAGRTPESVRLLSVTKTFPATDAALLTDLGLHDLAENRVQEAATKASQLAELRPSAPVRWHMVGRLQRNKTRSVARWASEVQSVDSLRLVSALDKAVRSALAEGERGEPLDVLVQLGLDDAQGRGGCAPAELDSVADAVAETDGLRLRGLMAVAPLDGDPEPAFDMLAEAARRLRVRHPAATELSAGMSGDIEAAIARGSTCVRVGTALLGGRDLAFPQ